MVSRSFKARLRVFSRNLTVQLPSPDNLEKFTKNFARPPSFYSCSDGGMCLQERVHALLPDTMRIARMERVRLSGRRTHFCGFKEL